MTINATSFSPFSAFSAVGSASATASSAATSSPSTAATTDTSGATSNGGVDTLDPTGTGGINLSTNDFMNLFLSQLQNQDPTQPVDDSQMLGELSQMSEIQTLQGVQTSLQGSQLAQSSALIGKNVTGMDVSGVAVNGVVTSVTQSTDAGLVLQVGTQYIKPDSVTVVTAAPAATTTP
jgi:flagellar basal-body rod modification protein FlgD